MKARSLDFVYFALLLFLYSENAWTAINTCPENKAEIKVLKLYQGGFPLSDYNSSMKWLEEQYVLKKELCLKLEFSDGKAITVEQVLGMGAQNIILKIKDQPKILRIRKRTWFPIVSLVNPAYASSTLSSYQQAAVFYEKNGVDFARIYPQESLWGERVVGEFYASNHYSEYLEKSGRIDYEMLSLESIVEEAGEKKVLNFEGKAFISLEKMNRIREAFLEFALSTWRFYRIGDFRGNQLIMTDQLKWIQLDATYDHDAFYNLDEGNVFERNHLDEAQSSDRGYQLQGNPITMKPGLSSSFKTSHFEKSYQGDLLNIYPALQGHLGYSDKGLLVANLPAAIKAVRQSHSSEQGALKSLVGGSGSRLFPKVAKRCSALLKSQKTQLLMNKKARL